MPQKRMSPAEFRRRYIQGGATSRTKFIATATVVDDIRFDSKGEAGCYVHLREMVKQRPDARLYLQVRFPLFSLPPSDVRGRAEVYTCDFALWVPTAIVVVDWKPRSMKAESRDARFRIAAFRSSFPEIKLYIWRKVSDIRWPFPEDD